MLREIKLEEWKAIQAKIRAWKDRFERIQTVLQAAQQAQAQAQAQAQPTAVWERNKAQVSDKEEKK